MAIAPRPNAAVAAPIATPATMIRNVSRATRASIISPPAHSRHRRSPGPLPPPWMQRATALVYHPWQNPARRTPHGGTSMAAARARRQARRMRVAASLRVARVGGRAGALSWPLLAVLAGLLVWFGPWLAAREPQMGGDVTLEFYPRLAYAVAAIRHGALPLWSPWTMAGTPLLANPQLGVLYPGHWPLLALLPVGMALNYAVALHLVLAAGATYALGRRWALTPGAAALAAMSYALNGMFAARLWAGNLSLLEVMAWAPAMLYAAERFRADPGPRTWLLLVGVLALSLLVGFYHPW